MTETVFSLVLKVNKVSVLFLSCSQKVTASVLVLGPSDLVLKVTVLVLVLPLLSSAITISDSLGKMFRLQRNFQGSLLGGSSMFHREMLWFCEKSFWFSWVMFGDLLWSVMELFGTRLVQ